VVFVIATQVGEGAPVADTDCHHRDLAASIGGAAAGCCLSGPGALRRLSRFATAQAGAEIASAVSCPVVP
jgi:hypothetical protein